MESWVATTAVRPLSFLQPVGDHRLIPESMPHGLLMVGPDILGYQGRKALFLRAAPIILRGLGNPARRDDWRNRVRCDSDMDVQRTAGDEEPRKLLPFLIVCR